MRALTSMAWRRALRATLGVLGALLLMPAIATAQSVTLAWDASPASENVVGYTVHVGINPGVYGQTFDVSGRTTTTFTFTQVTPGQRYYFAVSAYRADNVSSALSGEISWKLNTAPNLTQPSPQTGAVGVAVSLQLAATDDGDPLTYSATGLPSGLSINSSGRITGTPTTANTFTVNATVSDGSLTSTRSFPWTIGPALNVTAVSANLSSPQVIDTAIGLTAVATGGIPAYQYKFLATVNGTTTTLRNWGASANHTWTPSSAGSYVLTVWARSAGVTADAAEASRTLNFTINAGPLSVTGLSANLASPQVVNTAITLTAAASGGTSPYQYKYLVTLNGTTTTLRNWASSALATWTPTAAGAYTLTVWARNSGNTADAPDAQRTLNYTITPTPLAVTSFTASLASPRIVNTSIGLSAAASGGTSPHQFKFVATVGSTTTTLQNWSATSTFTWTPTAAGNYTLAVWARSAGNTTDAPEAQRTLNYTINAPLSVNSLTSSLTSPRFVNTSITFTAAASGGFSPYQFKYLATVGSTTTVLRTWGSSAGFTWTPTVPGNYVITVWARSSGNTADAAEASRTMNFTISGPLQLTSVTTSLPSPQSTGTAITLTANATGGTAPLQYQFYVYNGSTWSMVRDWNTNNTYSWTPTVASPDYQISVGVRNAGSTGNTPDAALTVFYVVTPAAGPLSVTSLTSSVQSPQQTGTSITFGATTSGGTTPLQYKWWLYNGSSWAVTQNWSSSSTWTWTPTTANANYQVRVWARNSTTTADVADAERVVPYAITAGPAGPLQLTSVTTSLPSPQSTGTGITVVANATGGTAPLQYQFYVYNGSTWSLVRDWSTSNTYAWTPTVASPNYQVSVGVRNATNTSNTPDDARTIFYVVTGASTPAPLSVSSLTSSVSSPQPPGTSITFAATTSGGTAPVQYKWWLHNGSSWAVVQNWSSAASWTWTPSAANPNHQVRVWARNATTTADVADAERVIPYAIASGPAGPLQLTSVTSDRPSPQSTGTAITLTANTSGGAAPLQYQWYIFNGSTWTLVQTWNTSNTYTWTPTVASPSYQVSVGVRNATNSGNTPDAALTVFYTITGATTPSPLSVASLTSSVPSPQQPGTAITFAAATSGGTSPIQFKWWLFDGSSWSVVQNWSSDATWTWTPTVANANHQVRVWARNATTTADIADAERVLPYAIAAGPAGPVQLNSVTSNVPSPQPPGVAITFTANATGGAAPLQYKWWIYNGSTWTMVRNWTTSSTYTWTPTVPNANYQISVGVRNATTTADSADAALTVNYAIEAPTGPLRVASVTSNIASPQVVGTPITLTANAVGGSSPYQYQWWVYNGSIWTLVQNWTGSNTFVWTPTTASANYQVSVGVRNAANTSNSPDAAFTVFYVINNP